MLPKATPINKTNMQIKEANNIFNLVFIYKVWDKLPLTFHLKLL